jgi:XTP/dITP diphosphohydrolase
MTPRRFNGSKLVVATHNLGKAGEIRTMLAPFGVTVLSHGELGLAVPEETGTTFLENAELKARAAAKTTNLPSLGDDSGLSVHALDGQPGLHTADWEGPNRDAMTGMARIQRELEARGVADTAEARTATFNCALALAWPDGHVESVLGQLRGAIVWPPRGGNGHGYDPTFQPEGWDVTCGEMEPEVKNRISHRADAFARLVARCFR